ncbi:MAG: hypothetical protein PVI90_15115 [Desulfobacteraceae bacterium]|jgi:hypothetical protein
MIFFKLPKWDYWTLFILISTAIIIVLSPADRKAHAGMRSSEQNGLYGTNWWQKYWENRPNHFGGCGEQTPDDEQIPDDNPNQDQNSDQNSNDLTDTETDADSAAETASDQTESDTTDTYLVAPCTEYTAGTQLGTLFTGPSEISGIVASREQADVLWIHQDSGNTPVLYAIRPDGTSLGQWNIKADFRIYDWEDIAIEPIESGPDLIWVGDIGNNAARDSDIGKARESIRIARLAEPVIDQAQAPMSGTVKTQDSFEFTYPDRPHDAEVLAVDPTTGDMYIFTKEEKAPVYVFRARKPFENSTLELVATLDGQQFEWLNSADFSPNGNELIIRNYYSASYWERSTGREWEVVLTEEPANVKLQKEPAGESIGFALDASGFYTVSEGEKVPIWFYQKKCN